MNAVKFSETKYRYSIIRLMSKALFLVLMSLSVVVSADDSADSLRLTLKSLKGAEKARVLLRLANQCLNTDASLSRSYIHEAYAIANQKDDKDLLAQCCVQEGLLLNSTGSYDSALKILTKALRINDWQPDSFDLARLYTVMGITNENAGNSDSALSYYQKSFVIYHNTSNYQGVANSYLNLGCLFLKLKKYQDATLQLQKALDVSLKHKKTASLGSIYNNLGIVNDIRGLKEKALEYYTSALELEEAKGNKSVMANIYNNMAIIYNDRRDYRQALDLLEKSVSLKLETGNREGTANSYTVMGDVYFNLGDIQKAAFYAEKALGIAREGKFRYVEANCRKQLAAIYQEKGDYKKAAEEWKKALALNDTLYNQSVSQKISDLQSKYELIQKDQENRILKQQISLQQLKQSRQRIYFRFLILAVIATTLVLIMVFILLRMKMLSIKRNKELYEKEFRVKELELAAKENAYRLLENEKRQEEIKKAFLMQQYQSEQEIRALELKNLNTSIQLKNKELTSLSANFVSMNDILGQIRRSLLNLKKYFTGEVPGELNDVISLINSNLDNDLNWRKFRITFEETYSGFLDNLSKKVPDLTLNEQKLCAYLYVGLSSNEIATVMNISLAAVNKNRQRLRKTLGLPANGDILEYLKSCDLQQQPIA